MSSLSVASYLTFTKTLITKLHNMGMAYDHRGVGNKFYSLKIWIIKLVHLLFKPICNHQELFMILKIFFIFLGIPNYIRLKNPGKNLKYFIIKNVW